MQKYEKYQKKAGILKALAHPIRLCIAKGLIEEKECNVTHMQECLGASQSSISQHLAKLKAARNCGIEEMRIRSLLLYLR